MEERIIRDRKGKKVSILLDSKGKKFFKKKWTEELRKFYFRNRVMIQLLNSLGFCKCQILSYSDEQREIIMEYLGDTNLNEILIHCPNLILPYIEKAGIMIAKFHKQSKKIEEEIKKRNLLTREEFLRCQIATSSWDSFCENFDGSYLYVEFLEKFKIKNQEQRKIFTQSVILHGSYDPMNVVCDLKSKRITIVDWDDIQKGLAFYDIWVLSKKLTLENRQFLVNCYLKEITK